MLGDDLLVSEELLIDRRGIEVPQFMPEQFVNSSVKLNQKSVRRRGWAAVSCWEFCEEVIDRNNWTSSPSVCLKVKIPCLSNIWSFPGCEMSV